MRRAARLALRFEAARSFVDLACVSELKLLTDAPIGPNFCALCLDNYTFSCMIPNFRFWFASLTRKMLAVL